MNVAEAKSHLKAILIQALPSDDRIIIEHVTEAYLALGGRLNDFLADRPFREPVNEEGTVPPPPCASGKHVLGTCGCVIKHYSGVIKQKGIDKNGAFIVLRHTNQYGTHDMEFSVEESELELYHVDQVATMTCEFQEPAAPGSQPVVQAAKRQPGIESHKNAAENRITRSRPR